MGVSVPLMLEECVELELWVSLLVSVADCELVMDGVRQDDGVTLGVRVTDGLARKDSVCDSVEAWLTVSDADTLGEHDWLGDREAVPDMLELEDIDAV